MTNLIPEGWKELRQGDVTQFHNGRAYKLSEWEKQGTPVIRLQNLTGSGKVYYYSNLELPAHQYCHKGDLLYMWSASFGPYIWNGPKAIYHYHIWKIEPDEANLTKHYCYHFLEYSTAAWKNSSNGMAMLHVTKGGMEELIVTLPPIPEQKKIAAILTSVDSVIEKTQAQIDKLNDLKTGMMQELLTKGIGPDGKPHTEFKDSPVGRIPVGWEISKLDSLSDTITSGSRGWAKYYANEGALFIRIGNLTREHINFRFKDVVYVNPPTGGEGTRTRVKEGDILISITADLGIIGVVNKSIPEAYVNQHVALVRPREIKYARWIGCYLSLEKSQKQFTMNNDAGAKSGLNLNSIANMIIAIPPKAEAEIIIQALDGVDELVVLRKNELRQTQLLKSALMADLLTGKVRTTPDA